MDRGTWWATVHRVAESDTTKVTEHARLIVRQQYCLLHTNNWWGQPVPTKAKSCLLVGLL